MDRIKVSEQTRRELRAMPPEKRSKIEAILARTHTPERIREREEVREDLDREFRETGTISAVSPEEADAAREILMRRARNNKL